MSLSYNYEAGPARPAQSFAAPQLWTESIGAPAVLGSYMLEADGVVKNFLCSAQIS
jgi:hypothetical protein